MNDSSKADFSLSFCESGTAAQADDLPVSSHHERPVYFDSSS